MNRKEMIDVLAECAPDVTKADISRIYDGFVDLAKKQLNAESEFMLPGLGALKVKVSKARTARNPQTGAPIFVPEKRNVRFSAYKELKELLNPPAAPAPEVAAPPPPAPEPPAPPTPPPATPETM